MKKALTILLIIFLIAIGAFAFYASDYYKADEAAIIEYLKGSKADDGCIVVLPEEVSDKALIFYPGGKVEYSAYIPLLEELASRGIVCFLPKMTFNLAILSPNKADEIIKEHKEINTWYIGGHSLGGAAASIYASKHQDAIDSLLLLASYSTKDISDSKIDVISIYGSEDGVLNYDSYEKYKKNLPLSAKEVIIKGGNHSGFGFYGPQKGDNDSAISKAQQIEETVAAIMSFIE